MSGRQNQNTKFPFNLKVVVVDDDEIFKVTTKKQLEEFKYEVENFKSIDNVNNYLDKHNSKVGIVLLEMNVLDKGTKQAQDKFFGFCASHPLILYSAECSAQSVYQAVQKGCVDFWQKPFQENQLKFIWQHVVRMEKAKRLTKEHSDKIKSNESQVSSDNQNLKCGTKRRNRANSYNQDSEQISGSTQLEKESGTVMKQQLSPSNQSIKGQQWQYRHQSANSKSSNQSSDLVDQFQISSNPDQSNSNQFQVPSNMFYPGFGQMGPQSYGMPPDLMSQFQGAGYPPMPIVPPPFQQDGMGAMNMFPPFPAPPPMVPDLPFIPNGPGFPNMQMPFMPPMPPPQVSGMLPENFTPDQFSQFQKAFMEELQRFNAQMLQNSGMNQFVNPEFSQNVPTFTEQVKQQGKNVETPQVKKAKVNNYVEPACSKLNSFSNYQSNSHEEVEEVEGAQNCKTEDQEQDQLKQDLKNIDFDIKHLDDELAIQTFEELFEDENKMGEIHSPRFRDTFYQNNNGGGFRKNNSFTNLAQNMPQQVS